MSQETQLRLSLGSIAGVLFVIAGWIFATSGAGSAAMACLSFGMVALTLLVLVTPSSPSK